MIDYKQIPLAAKPDRQDKRDKYKSDRYKSGAPIQFPNEFSLPFLPPIKNQRQTSSCTGHSAAYFMEQIIVSRGSPWVRLAPFYPWYYARKEEGVETKDEGVQMRTIMSALNKNGICPEEAWPFDPSVIAQHPSEGADIMAALRIPTFERCDDLQSIKYSLFVEQQSVCIGVTVRNCWYDSNVQSDGRIPFKPDSKEVGGHAITAVGWNKNELIFANSWGNEWGDRGFLHYPLDYLDTDWFDAWTAGFNTLPQHV